MNIAEKCALLKADMDALHKAGGNTEEAFEAGRQDVISKSKYIPKTVSGKGVFLNDVSEVAHKVKVYADTPTEVKVCGANLLDIEGREVVNFGASSNTTKRSFTGNGIIKGYAYSNYYQPSNITSFEKHKNGYSYSTKVKAYSIGIDVKVSPNTTYSVYFDGITQSNCQIGQYDTDGNYIGYEFTGSGVNGARKITTKENTAWVVINPQTAEDNGTGFCNNFFFGVGGFTGFEEYKCQTITAIPNGAEVHSICPKMTFLADNDVTIDYFGSYGMAEAELAWANAITSYGKRNTYIYGLAYSDYTGLTIPEGLFKPVTGSIAYLFYAYTGTALPKGIDLSEFSVDTVSAGGSTNMYNGATRLGQIPDMGLGAAKSYEAYARNCSQLRRIEVIRCAEHSVFTNAFQNDTELTHCIFEGTIASDINLQWSPKLSLESLISLFYCLKDFISEGPDNINTKTITLSSESWALLSDYLVENGYEDHRNAQDVIQKNLGWNVA